MPVEYQTQFFISPTNCSSDRARLWFRLIDGETGHEEEEEEDEEEDDDEEEEEEVRRLA